MKSYHCTRDSAGVGFCYVVTARENYLLPPRLDLANKSPTGIDWGYSGSGPAQLALAILADHFEPYGTVSALGDGLSLCLYQNFKDSAIARQAAEGFTIDTTYVRAALAMIAESHGEPLAMTLAAVIARDLTAAAGAPKGQTPYSYEVLLARYAGALMSGIGCSAAFAERLLTLANAGELYHDLTTTSGSL